MKRFLTFAFSECGARVAFIGFLASSPLYVLCRWTHFCMGGHLLDHGDLGHSHHAVVGYISDFIWMVGFVFATLLAFFSGITFRYVSVFAGGVLFLIVADPRGIGGFLAWPVLAALCVFTIACLRGWID